MSAKSEHDNELIRRFSLQPELVAEIELHQQQLQAGAPSGTTVTFSDAVNNLLRKGARMIHAEDASSTTVQ
jgi:hypothetical protein